MRSMEWPKVGFALILFICVMESLSLPHFGHKKIHSHNARGKEGPLHSKKSQTKHRNYQAAIGAPRQVVPSPVQDFVLLSGSPLFHERIKAGDNITNASNTNGQDKIGGQDTYGQGSDGGQTPAQAQGYGQSPSQITPHDQQGVSLRPSLASQGNGQHFRPVPSHGQTSQTIQPPGQSTHDHELGTGHLGKPISASENQEQQEGTQGSDIGTNQKQTKMNGTVQLLSEANRANITQVNASVQITNLTVNGQSFGGSGTISLGQLGNQSNASNAAANLTIALQGQNPVAGHFPFNVLGVRHYGGDRTGDQGNKQLEKDIGKDHGQNLAPHCHWKSTKGKDGTIITAVACSGEFSTSEASKTEGNQKPLDNEHVNAGGIEAVSGYRQGIQTKTGNGSEAGVIAVGKQVQSDSEFQAEAIETTNAFRKTHSVQPMRLNAELSHQATEFAKKIAGLGSLQHDFDTVRQLDEGENLAMGCKQYGVPLTAKEAITNWYNEVCAYDFNRSEFSMETGHFTQVVWSDSQEFGIGKAAGEQNGMPCIFVVGRFKPSGNYKSEYKKNVFKGSFDASYCEKLRDKKLL